MKIASRAEAMSNASSGQTLSVKILNSQKILRAKALDPETVVITW
jgi:flagella basal body P-ring formation protein FlgA